MIWKGIDMYVTRMNPILKRLFPLLLCRTPSTSGALKNFAKTLKASPLKLDMHPLFIASSI
jgi:hypothetical protein